MGKFKGISISKMFFKEKKFIVGRFIFLEIKFYYKVIVIKRYCGNGIG